jgi:hypothetical protein
MIHGPESFPNQSESDDTMMYNIVLTYALPQIDRLSLGFDWNHGYMENRRTSGHEGNATDGGGTTANGTSGAHWWATAGYAMLDFTDNQMGALRYEYYNDEDGAKGFDYSLWTLTYTHNITIADNIMFRPEIRHNHYNVQESKELTHGEVNATGGYHTFKDETIIGVGVEYIF